MTLGSLFYLIYRGKTFARNGKRQTLQTPCKCLANLQVLPNAFLTLPMARECLRILTANDSICNIHRNLGDAS